MWIEFPSIKIRYTSCHIYHGNMNIRTCYILILICIFWSYRCEDGNHIPKDLIEFNLYILRMRISTCQTIWTSSLSLYFFILQPILTEFRFIMIFLNFPSPFNETMSVQTSIVVVRGKYKWTTTSFVKKHEKIRIYLKIV